MLALPTDRLGQTGHTYQRAKHIFNLSTSLSTALNAFSKHEEVTLFMTLLAAFQTLLFRYSGQNDISIGTPITNLYNQTSSISIPWYFELIYLAILPFASYWDEFVK